jgi:hypothetical protein
MNPDRRPDSVLDKEPIELPGYSSVACVAAVIHNELKARGFLTANRVIAAFSISDNHALGLTSAAQLIEKVSGQRCAPQRSVPWDPGAAPGHYAVFSIGRPFVVYGRREQSRFYLYDPKTERDWTLNELQQAGYGPFLGYFVPT